MYHSSRRSRCQIQPQVLTLLQPPKLAQPMEALELQVELEVSLEVELEAEQREATREVRVWVDQAARKLWVAFQLALVVQVMLPLLVETPRVGYPPWRSRSLDGVAKLVHHQQW